MIGILITGHGDFAKGLLSSLNMIAGEQEQIHAISFDENENLEGYQAKVTEAIDTLLVETKGVVVCADLLGGTPFRTAMLSSVGYANVEVITGTNLPMLLESTVLRYTDSATALANLIVENGKTGIQHPILELDDEPAMTEDFEGGL